MLGWLHPKKLQYLILRQDAKPDLMWAFICECQKAGPSSLLLCMLRGDAHHQLIGVLCIELYHCCCSKTSVPR